MNSVFKGKTVIITGASAGVGAACARAFANHKANLVLCARGQAGLDTIAEELSAQCSVLTVAMDVSNTDQCLALLTKAEAEFGRVDVLINNAGMHSRGNIEKVEPADVAMMVDINLRAPLMLSCAALPFIKKSDGGASRHGGFTGGHGSVTRSGDILCNQIRVASLCLMRLRMSYKRPILRSA